MSDAVFWAARARRWVGTPYVHQAACRGAGCDCLGLVRGLWREAFGGEPELVPPYSADWSEPQNDELLWQAAARLLRPVEIPAMQSGHVILFRMRAGAVAKHLGIAGITGAVDAAGTPSTGGTGGTAGAANSTSTAGNSVVADGVFGGPKGHRRRHGRGGTGSCGPRRRGGQVGRGVSGGCHAHIYSCL